MQLVLREKKKTERYLHGSGRSQTRENTTGVLLLLSVIVATGSHCTNPNGLNSCGETVLYLSVH